MTGSDTLPAPATNSGQTECEGAPIVLEHGRSHARRLDVDPPRPLRRLTVRLTLSDGRSRDLTDRDRRDLARLGGRSGFAFVIEVTASRRGDP